MKSKLLSLYWGCIKSSVLIFSPLINASTGSGLKALTAEPAPVANILLDVNKTLAEVSPAKIGMNLNFWFDSEAFFPRDRPLSEALKELGTCTLRYPGGCKSQKDLWSVPPFEKSQPTVCRVGDTGWPWDNAASVFAPDGSYVDNKMDFDAFMEVCRAIEAEPVVVVNCQGHKAPEHAKNCVSLERLLDTAEAWVRYANIEKGYAVKYWEIGNEPCLENHMGPTGKMTAKEYAEVLVQFSRRMKAVDPGIQIGGWRSWSPEWMQTLFDIAAADMDFVICHSYFTPDGFEDYRGKPFQETNALRDVFSADVAIAQLPAPYNRFPIMVTEYGAREWTGKAWPETNDWGHAMVTFDMTGRMLMMPRLGFAAFWNTRWFGLDDYACVALTEKENNLTAIGKAIAFFAHHLGNRMIEARSTHFMVSSYASMDDATHTVKLFVLNKNRFAERISPVFHSHEMVAIRKTTMLGQSLDDPSPSISPAIEISIDDEGPDCWLVEPESITLFEFKLDPSTGK